MKFFVKKILLSYTLLALCGVIILLFAASCSPTKHLSKNGYLLSRNKIKIEGEGISKSEINKYIQQEPNHRFLGIKMGMYIYSASRPLDDTNCNFIERYIFRGLGDKPVEIDNSLTQQSVNNIKTYLKTIGCFDAEIHSQMTNIRRPYAPWTKYKKRKKINYFITPHCRAIIDTFFVNAEDKSLQTMIESMTKNNSFKKGEYYNEEKMATIRSNIANKMLDSGYYAFNESYITFSVDTLSGIEKTKIILNVSNPSSKYISKSTSKHIPYIVKNIYISQNYIPPTSADYIPNLDTTKFYHKQQRGYKATPLFFINNTPKPIIKERAIMRCILMQSNHKYSPLATKNTYSALSNLQNFKYIDISFQPSVSASEDTGILDCYIRLTKNKPISLSTSFELNYSASNNPVTEQQSSNFGTGITLSYSDKNFLKGAEIFTASTLFAAEINSDIFKAKNMASGWDIFNAFEAGINLGLELPRFLAPFSTAFYSMNFHPHTSISTGFNIQKRSYYERSIFNLKYGYSWNTTQKKYFALIPVEINYVNMNITNQNYQNYINSMDRRIQYQMSDHLVTSTRFSYVYNGQVVENKRDFNYFNLNFEISGNILDLYSHAVNQSKNNDGFYTIVDIPFSQYVRTDFSFVRYKYLNGTTTFVYRIFGGVGYAYGNAIALPYEKSFFAGGANNIRAWQMRSLGPGSSKSSENLKYDRAGDMTFGGNIELRFPMIGSLNGALFADFGNIWTIRDENGMEGGKISKDFYKEIALGIGYGIRLDLKILVIRLDLALKAIDPSRAENRFVLDNAKWSDLTAQFGIGYPF